MPETLKTLSDICEPDPRNLGWKIRNHDTGLVRDLTLVEHHSAVEGLALEAVVPEDLLTLYNTSRNVLLYSWYAYRFITVAELQAYATLEYALRWRLGRLYEDDPPTLSPLLNAAVKQGLLTDEAFRPLREQTEPPVYTGHPLLDANIDPALVAERGHVNLLSKILPRLRNELAHGSVSIWPNAIATFLVVKTAIESLAATNLGPVA